MIEKIYVVMGLAPTGLFFVRELSREQKKVYAIGQNNDIGLYSKYGIKNVVNNLKDLKKHLIMIRNENKNTDIVLIPTNSYFLDLTLNLQESFMIDNNLLFEDIPIIKSLKNKSASQKTIENNNFFVPLTFEFDEYNLIKDFPIILKWNGSKTSVESNPIPKVTVLNNKSELLEKVKYIKSNFNELRNNLIFQEYLNPKEHKEYGFGGFFKNGKPIMIVNFEQKRQFPIGISTYAIGISKDEQENKFIQWVKDLSYSGFIQFDYFISNNNDKTYILDINPRPWGSMKILKAKYKNFSKLLIDNSVKPIIRTRKPVFIKGLQDTVAIFKNLKFPYSYNFLKRVLSLFRTNKARDLFDLRDIKPFIIGLPMRFKKK